MPAFQFYAGFNGAAIARSRNCSSSVITSGLCCSFNGAAIARSRNWPPPRLRSPKSPQLQWGRDRAIAEFSVCVRRWPAHAQLQWGRDRAIAELLVVSCRPVVAFASFNGAAIARSRNWSAASSAAGRPATLQWGRDRAIAEFGIAAKCLRGHRGFNGAAIARSRNCAGGAAITRKAEASMGPRSRDRGIDPLAGHHRIVGGASMGPRSRDRGIADKTEMTRRASSRFNGAAIARSRNCR